MEQPTFAIMNYFYIVFILWLYYHTTYTQLFLWFERNKEFDYIVGISANGIPLCPGVIITTRTIITAANPLEPYYQNKSAVKVFTVLERYNQSVSQNIESIIGNQASRNNVWVQVGFDRTHTTVHDVLLITLQTAIEKSSGRGPTFAALPFVDSIFNAPLPNSGWKVAGFGYLDKRHIKNNTELEVTDLPGSLVDCDEWLPREWGLFICITDDENLKHIPCGGPLINGYQRGKVFGLASFTLKKGNDSILVFTDMKAYRFGLKGYIANATQKSETNKTKSKKKGKRNFYRILPMHENRG